MQDTAKVKGKEKVSKQERNKADTEKSLVQKETEKQEQKEKEKEREKEKEKENVEDSKGTKERAATREIDYGEERYVTPWSDPERLKPQIVNPCNKVLTIHTNKCWNKTAYAFL